MLGNADNAAFLVESASTPRQSQDGRQCPQFEERCVVYLPACSHASMLATSRSGAAALKIVNEKGILRVEPMDELHAVALIKKSLECQYKQEEIDRLARAPDFMPLAMAQATARISQRA